MRCNTVRQAPAYLAAFYPSKPERIARDRAPRSDLGRLHPCTMTKVLQKLPVMVGDLWRAQRSEPNFDWFNDIVFTNSDRSSLNKCEGGGFASPQFYEFLPLSPNRRMASRYPLLKKWTSEDHELLKSLALAGRRPNEIADKLQRTEAAIRVRAWQHGITLRRITQKRSS
jgi:hypothetical protein